MKTIIAFVFGVSLLLILGLFALSFTDRNQTEAIINTYQKSDSSRPKLSIDQTIADLGPMKVKDEGVKDFVIKNIGDKTLQISGINSSCNCATAKFIVNGVESGEFGMHKPGTQVFEVVPNAEAVIRVIYRPYVMPVYGFVSREVYADTNDPDMPKLVLRVTTNVSK